MRITVRLHANTQECRVDGAERVIKRVSQENVICTLDWLLYGKGQEPYILSKYHNDVNLDDETLILKEISLFQSFYPDAIFTQIKDDCLSPQFVVGDYVGGRKVTSIEEAINKNCIIELPNGELMVRYLKKGLIIVIFNY